jgi:hypothetical protein
MGIDSKSSRPEREKTSESAAADAQCHVCNREGGREREIYLDKHNYSKIFVKVWFLMRRSDFTD